MLNVCGDPAIAPEACTASQCGPITKSGNPATCRLPERNGVTFEVRYL
jgi:hypothetical protein